MILDRAASFVLGIILLSAVSGVALGQGENVNLLVNVDNYGYHSDIWGYTGPGGEEIAVIGTGTGTSFVDVTDPNDPDEVLFVPGGSSTWRDMKSFGEYVYIVDDEAGDGLIVVDMSDPLNPVEVSRDTSVFFTVHNIYVDEAAAILIACGDGNDTYFFDLSVTPEDPQWIYTHDGRYQHDVYSRDGILYGAEIFDGILSTYDMTQLPGSLPFLDSIPSDGFFTHNVWLTDDGNYALTTDEVGGGHITIIDVSDPSNLQKVGSYEHPDDPSAIVHNVLVDGDFAYVAWYKNGLEVLDMAYPEFPGRVGYYDTFPGGGTGFDGQWGTYPFAASGNVYCSDMSTGLYVFDVDTEFGRAVGTVTDADGGAPIEGVKVRVLGSGAEVTTLDTGFYKHTLDPGTSTLEFSLFGYQTETEPVFVVVGGNTEIDVELTKLPSGGLVGTVREGTTLNPIAGATVELENTPLKTTTDGAGEYDFPDVPAGSYTIRASAFGFGSRAQLVTVSGGGQTTGDVELQESPIVYEAETVDGWSAGAAGDNATTGIWVRVNPLGTQSSGGVQMQPEDDHTVAPGTDAWITGQGFDPFSIGENDVDDGRTTLLSPVFDLSSFADPKVAYHLWYINDGNGSVDDIMEIDVSSDGGSSWTTLEDIAEANREWERREFRIADFVTPTSEVRLRFIAQDNSPGSIVEAGVDDLEVFDGVDSPSDVPGADPIVRATRLLPAAPNPFPAGREGALRFQLARGQSVTLDIVDVQGRRVARLVDGVLPAGNHAVAWDGRDDAGRPLPGGIYFQRFDSADATETGKLVVLK